MAEMKQAGNCCTPCDEVVVSNVPGPQGDPGTNGTNGTDGENAYTTLGAAFTVPAVGADEEAEVENSNWASVGQIIFLQFGGYFEVTATADSTHMTLENLGYDGNAAPATVIPFGAKVSPAGIIGATGADGADGFSSPTNSKGDLIVDDGTASPSANIDRLPVGADGKTLHADSAQALGVAWAKVDLADATEVDGILAITNGGTGQVTANAAFNALAPTTTEGDLIYRNATINTRLAKGTANQQLRMNAGATAPEWFTPTAEPDATRYVLLGQLTPDLDSTGDQSITISSSRYIVAKIIAENADVDLSSDHAIGGIYSSPAKAGDKLVDNTFEYNMATADDFLDVTLETPATAKVRTEGTLYFSLSTAYPHGASHCNIWIFGYNLE